MRKIIPIITANLALVLAIGVITYTQSKSKSNTKTELSNPTVLSAQSDTLPQTASPSAELMQTPKSVTLAFYESYVNCMKNPPLEESNRARNYCQSHNPYTTADFFKNMESHPLSGLGFDQVICTQSAPKEIQVGGTNDPQNGQVTVAIINVLKEGKQINMQAVTTQTNNQWKINNILCP